MESHLFHQIFFARVNRALPQFYCLLFLGLVLELNSTFEGFHRFTLAIAIYHRRSHWIQYSINRFYQNPVSVPCFLPNYSVAWQSIFYFFAWFRTQLFINFFSKIFLWFHRFGLHTEHEGADGNYSSGCWPRSWPYMPWSIDIGALSWNTRHSVERPSRLFMARCPLLVLWLILPLSHDPVELSKNKTHNGAQWNSVLPDKAREKANKSLLKRGTTQFSPVQTKLSSIKIRKPLTIQFGGRGECKREAPSRTSRIRGPMRGIRNGRSDPPRRRFRVDTALTFSPPALSLLVSFFFVFFSFLIFILCSVPRISPSRFTPSTVSFPSWRRTQLKSRKIQLKKKTFKRIISLQSDAFLPWTPTRCFSLFLCRNRIFLVYCTYFLCFLSRSCVCVCVCVFVCVFSYLEPFGPLADKWSDLLGRCRTRATFSPNVRRRDLHDGRCILACLFSIPLSLSLFLCLSFIFPFSSDSSVFPRFIHFTGFYIVFFVLVSDLILTAFLSYQRFSLTPFFPLTVTWLSIDLSVSLALT